MPCLWSKIDFKFCIVEYFIKRESGETLKIMSIIIIMTIIISHLLLL